MKPYEENSDATDMAPIPDAMPASSKLAEGVNLDTNGVVVIAIDGVHAWMHPYSFRDMFPEYWEELLARPRVQSEYTEEELSK